VDTSKTGVGAGGVFRVVEMYRPMRVISFKIDERLVHVIDRVAKECNMSRSEVIRRSITFYLSWLGVDYEYNM